MLWKLPSIVPARKLLKKKIDLPPDQTFSPVAFIPTALPCAQNFCPIFTWECAILSKKVSQCGFCLSIPSWNDKKSLGLGATPSFSLPLKQVHLATKKVSLARDLPNLQVSNSSGHPTLLFLFLLSLGREMFFKMEILLKRGKRWWVLFLSLFFFIRPPHANQELLPFSALERRGKGG